METGNLIFSIALTWTVGLVLPAVVRFLVYRRPLISYEALAWAFGLAFVELILFVVLGSTSKTHAVLLVIGTVAYKLLQARSGPLDVRLMPARTVMPPNLAVTDETIANAPAASSGAKGASKRSIAYPSKRLMWFWIAVAVCWVAVVAGRTAYELSGESSTQFLVSRTDYVSDLREHDLAALENSLRDTFGTTPGGATQGQGGVAYTPVDKTSSVFDDMANEERAKRALQLTQRLSEFQLQPLSDAAINTLSSELSMSSDQIRAQPIVARQLLRLREVRRMMESSPVLKSQILGTRSPTYSAQVGVIVAIACMPPIAAFLVGVMLMRGRQGFRRTL